MLKRILIAIGALVILLALGIYFYRDVLRCEGRPDGARIGGVMVIVGC